jgi:hypothetical protein
MEDQGMRIMGLDLSMTCTGVCFPDDSTAVIKPRGKGDRPSRSA